MASASRHTRINAAAGPVAAGTSDGGPGRQPLRLRGRPKSVATPVPPPEGARLTLDGRRERLLTLRAEAQLGAPGSARPAARRR